jgi:crotonobetaine/carnitine-CoA ligase
VRAFLDRACAARGDAPFLVFRGRTWGYAEMGAITDAIAGGLLSLGVSPGDRLAMQLPTGPDHLFLWLGTAKAGIVSCPLHTDLAPPEVEAVLRHLEPRGFIDPAGQLAIDGRRVAAVEDLMTSGASLDDTPAPPPESIATILTTSGTTGTPKSAMLSHRMAVLTGEGFAHWLRLSENDRLFTCLPLSHINARFYSTLGAIALGASLALEERFSASRFWEWVRASGATQANTIGAMLKILIDRERDENESAHRLRLVYTAPALGTDAHLAFEKRFGTRLVVGYGLTESTFGFIHPLEGPRDLDAMGIPRRHPDPAIPAEVKLVDGEVWLKNPATFSGYFRDDDATRDTFAENGWLKTGDLARVGADGAYTFVGRKKLVIRRRGENVAPGEVEGALESHPAVLEAGVIGVPSPLGEDDVMAFVVFRPGMKADESELAAHCVSRLAAFKVPTRWRVVASLPRTPTQRVAYHVLRHM